MDNNKRERSLRMVNTLMGYGVAGLNVCYDDEDAEIFDEILTSRLCDLAEVFSKLFTKMLEDAPEEMRQMAVCELLEMMNAEIFG